MGNVISIKAVDLVENDVIISDDPRSKTKHVVREVSITTGIGPDNWTMVAVLLLPFGTLEYERDGAGYRDAFQSDWILTVERMPEIFLH